MSVSIALSECALPQWMMRFRDSVRPSLLVMAAAGAIYELMLEHFDEDVSKRHATAQKLNATPTGHWSDPETYVQLSVADNDATLTLSRPGITRAIKDVTIRPRQASALTIPVAALSYGRRVSEVERLLGKPLFRPKGTNILAASRDDGSLEPLYILASSVFQKRDPSLLPSRKQVDAALAEAAINVIETAAVLAAKGV